MWLRQAFFRWLIPAAFLLPLWLLVGWGVFAGGWTILWVLFIAIPSVFVGQLVLTLLTRSRPSVRAERAVSWWDVGGFALWHGLTVAVGCFFDGAFGWLLAAAVLVGIGMFWLQFLQLWSEVKANGAGFRQTVSWSMAESVGRTDPSPGAARAHDVIVVRETDARD